MLPDLSRGSVAPTTTRNAEVCWVNKPANRRLTGILFGDGSSIQRGLDARAGWALVQTDACGELIAAVYGPVPVDIAPKQSSVEAEDYVLSKAADSVMLPERIMIDCLGTVRAANSHPMAVTGPGHPKLIYG